MRLLLNYMDPYMVEYMVTICFEPLDFLCYISMVLFIIIAKKLFQKLKICIFIYKRVSTIRQLAL